MGELTIELHGSVAVVIFDLPGAKVNTLGSGMADHFETVWKQLDENKQIKSVVLMSGKENSFIAGGDIEEFTRLKTVEEATRLSQLAHEMIARAEKSKWPVVAAIHGTCLGGGVELILSCHYRLATDHKSTTFALPEIMLGILPGGGGTQRLPQLIGVKNALDLMLTGRSIRARQAKKMGLVDEVVQPYGFKEAAIQTAIRLADGTLKRKPREKDLFDRWPGCDIAFWGAKKEVMAKTQGVYPSPFKIIDAVKTGICQGQAAGYKKEAQYFGELSQTPHAKSLMGLFFLQTAHKKNPYPSARAPSNIGILGAGFMGSGIALVSIQNDMKVRMQDVKAESLSRGQKMIWGEFSKRVKRKSMTSFERDQLMARLTTQSDYHRFDTCDLVIEAIFEDLKLKQTTLSNLENHVSPDCVLASNTSALPISQIGSSLKHPERLLGMHYFSPVQKMPLLEIIKTPKTTPQAIGAAYEVGLKQGKTIVVVNDGPGFYTTRILTPMLDEASILALEGNDPHKLDLLMQQFGFPVGPITLMDEVGLDVAEHVADELNAAFGSRFTGGDTNALKDMIAKGYLGRKAQKGFYLYPNQKSSWFNSLRKMLGSGKHQLNYGLLGIFNKYKRKPGLANQTDADIQHRMALRLVNEAFFCLQEGILDNKEDGNLAAVFGLGFPPFHGGPFGYADKIGARFIVDQLNRFSQHMGERFKPAQALVDMAR